MRIIGGKFKKRQILVPKARSTRPMTDETREAVFNILGPVEGLVVLDLYAGSGVIGLEALSRGVSHVDGVEKDHHAADVIRRNIKSLNLENNYKLYEQSVENWLKKADSRYELIFSDPPFDKLNHEIFDELPRLLKPGGLLVIKHSKKTELGEIKALNQVTTRRYGGSIVSFYKS